MCGRFAQRTPSKRLAEEFKVEAVPEVEARYNIAPTQNILGVREGTDGREMTFFKWGLIPSWAKDASMGARLINARSETIGEKPAFREAFKERRCIIPADGFYEWQRTGEKKQPFFFCLSDESSFGFAGLWEKWQDGEGKAIESCTIITTEANAVLRPVHDRMPVILHPDEYALWLGGDKRQRGLLVELLRPYPAEAMVGYPVSPLVNSPSSKGADLTAEVQLNSA